MSDVSELLPHLKVLAAFGETGQVTSTAEVLGIAQPQVSRSLSRVEEITGLTLRLRDGRSVTPSRAALELGATSRALLSSLEQTLNSLKDELRGHVAIAFQHSLGETLVPAAIKNYLLEQPAVDFGLTQGSRQDCITAVESGRADVAFIAVTPDSLTLSTTHIYDEELMLAVPEGHPLAQHTEVTSGDIAGEDLISLRHGLGLRSTIDSLLSRWGIQPNVAFEGQEISTVLGLVAAGLGVAIVPRRPYALPVRLVAFKNRDAIRPIVMVTARGRELPLPARLFVESVQRYSPQR